MIRFQRGTFALFAAAAAFASPAPALAQQGDPIYHIYYFSDETQQEVVGIHYGDCTYWGPVTHAWLEGQTSPYSEQYVAGYCYQGVWQPL